MECSYKNFLKQQKKCKICDFFKKVVDKKKKNIVK